MNRDTEPVRQPADEFSAGEQSVLFARLVLQLADLARVTMGRVPNPATGQTTRDLDAARMFIDQLAVLELKTRGNLTPEETRLLRDTLMNLRLAFVDAVEEADRNATPQTNAPNQQTDKPQTPTDSSTTTADNQTAKTTSSAEPADSGSRRRFFKKYDV